MANDEFRTDMEGDFLTVLDLFSGIGGFSLGLESTGLYKTLAFCEIEEFPRKVLNKHWPDVPCYRDVRTLSQSTLTRDGIGHIDLVVGGFPCQPVSLAGKRKGEDDERWLWPEFNRIISEVKPTWVIAENVPGLRTKGSDSVLSNLEEQRYTSWPLVVGAIHAGAPHRRQRVWIVAHAQHDWAGRREQQQEGSQGSGNVAGDAADTKSQQTRIPGQPRQRERLRIPVGWNWATAPESVLRGVDDGLSCGMDRRQRLKALGNAVVPQVVAAIGRSVAYIEAHKQDD